MKNFSVCGSVPWLRVFLRVLFACVLAVIFTIVVGLLRGTCHLSTTIIGFSVLIMWIVLSSRLARKNSYVLSDDILTIEEHFIGRKVCRMCIPISQIDACILRGYYPFVSVELTVHGRSYVLSNVTSATEFVHIVNDSMEERI